MKRWLFALLFLLGGVAHEVRHPLQCTAIVGRPRSTRRRAAID